MHKSLILLIIILFLSISACQTVPKYLPPSPEMLVLWEKHRIQLTQLKEWQLNGRIAILTPEEHLTLNVHWDHMDDAYVLRFTVPPGQGAFLIRGDKYSVVMHTSDDKIYTARDPDVLMAQILKVEVPVSHLYTWIRGIPLPEIDVKEYALDSEGNLSYLHQADWTIDYKSYLDEDNLKLPHKLFLKNNDIEVRIVISDWIIEENTFADK